MQEDVRVVVKVLFHEQGRVAFDCANVSEGIHGGDGEILHDGGKFRGDDDENLHSDVGRCADDECRDDGGNLHNDVENVQENGDGGGILADEILRADVGLCSDDVKNVQVSGDDVVDSHSGDENKESDEKGNNATVHDENDEIRSVRICDGESQSDDDQRENDDDGSDDHHNHLDEKRDCFVR